MFNKKKIISFILVVGLLLGNVNTVFADRNNEEINYDYVAVYIANELKFYFDEIGHIEETGDYVITNPELLKQKANSGDIYANEILKEYNYRNQISTRSAKDVLYCAVKDQYSWAVDLLSGKTLDALAHALASGAWTAAGKILSVAIKQASKLAGKAVGWAYTGASIAYSVYKCRKLL